MNDSVFNMTWCRDIKPLSISGTILIKSTINKKTT